MYVSMCVMSVCVLNMFEYVNVCILNCTLRLVLLCMFACMSLRYVRYVGYAHMSVKYATHVC